MDVKVILPLLILSSQIASAQLVTFGTDTNQFSMEFVTIGNPGNAADTTGDPNPVGAVAYTYQIGKYEVSRDMILKATSAGGLGITLADMTSRGGNGANRPATGVSWNEAARFVNWLNTSKGYQAAYNFTTSGANDNITLWGAGQYSGSNPFRHKDAIYVLPTVDEWYKAAYGKADGTGWYDFPNGSDTAPTAVASGTANNRAVYGQNTSTGPADITNAGGLSPYGTMAQGGNVWELSETAYDRSNDSASENREQRGASWSSTSDGLKASLRGSAGSTNELINSGFRVASVPEPGSASLVILGLAAVLARRRRSARGVAARR